MVTLTKEQAELALEALTKYLINVDIDVADEEILNTLSEQLNELP